MNRVCETIGCGKQFPRSASPLRRFCPMCVHDRRLARTLALNIITRATFKEVGLRCDGEQMKVRDPISLDEEKRRHALAKRLIKERMAARGS